MKNKSLFTQIILLIVLALVCLVLTVSIALLVGSESSTIFDFRNLNLANVIPVLLIGGFISCVVVGITVLCVTRSAFFKIKDYLKENNKNNGGTQK